MDEDILRAHRPAGAVFWASGSGVAVCKHTRARRGSALGTSAHSPCGEKKAESQYRTGNPSLTSVQDSVGRLAFWANCLQVVINNMYLVRSQGQGGAAEDATAAPLKWPWQPPLVYERAALATHPRLPYSVLYFYGHGT